MTHQDQDPDRPAVPFSDPVRDLEEADRADEKRLAAAAAIVVVSVLALVAFFAIRNA